jgi:predicted secreted protein
MKRSKKILLVAHCLLNQNTRAQGIARKPGVVEKLVKFALKNNLGLIQLPCPEVLWKGLDRKPQKKEYYDKPQFRKICKDIAHEYAGLIKDYRKKKYQVIGLVGVNGSPSCAENGILIQEFRKRQKLLFLTLL